LIQGRPSDPLLPMADEGCENEFDPEMDVETFIWQYELDENAAAALRSSPEDVVKSVISQGPPTGTNPSALIMARLREVSAETTQDWDSFISVVDERAKELFCAQSEELQQTVMAEGPLFGSNPSAILMARIRKAGGTTRGGGSVAKVKAPTSLGVQRGGRQLQASTCAGFAKSSGQGLALQNLGLSLCKLNGDMWNFDVPAETLLATFKSALKARETAVATFNSVPKTRKAAVASVGKPPVAAVSAVSEECSAEWPEEEWPEEEWPVGNVSLEPVKKKARQAGGVSLVSKQQMSDGLLSEDDKEQRREAVLAEVVQMLTDAGGSMLLQDIGSKHLTDLRKGAVANLSKFLSSRPDMVTVVANDGDRCPTVSLATA